MPHPGDQTKEMGLMALERDQGGISRDEEHDSDRAQSGRVRSED